MTSLVSLKRLAFPASFDVLRFCSFFLGALLSSMSIETGFISDRVQLLLDLAGKS